METVLALHCSGSTGAQWRSLAARLGGRYRLIAPELRSPGSLEAEAAPLVALMARQGEPVHLVGHSYGGAVALHIARTRPAQVRSLTLIEPSAFHLLRGGDAIDTQALEEITAVARDARSALADGDYMTGFGRFVDYWSGPGSWDAMPAAKREGFAPLLANIALDFRALLNEPAALAGVAHLAVPTLLLQGGCTRLPSRCVVHRLRQALPRAGFSVVGGAGHMLPVTHRDQVNARVAEHLAANAAPVLREAA